MAQPLEVIAFSKSLVCALNNNNKTTMRGLSDKLFDVHKTNFVDEVWYVGVRGNR
jgi:hypothetical protein